MVSQKKEKKTELILKISIRTKLLITQTSWVNVYKRIAYSVSSF